MNIQYIDYPLHLDDRGQTAKTTREDYIRDLIEQLLFTTPGERVNRPDFGSGLLQMVFEPNSPEIAATLQTLIQAGLDRWLGHLIQVHGLDVASDDALLRVTVIYEVLAEANRPSEPNVAIYEWGTS